MIFCFFTRLDAGVNATHIEYFFTNLWGLVQSPLAPPSEVLLNVFDIVENMGYTAETLLQELMQPCSKMLYRCSWLNKEVPCEELFRVTKGSEGFCCSFNYNATTDVMETERYFRVSGKIDSIRVVRFSFFEFSNQVLATMLVSI